MSSLRLWRMAVVLIGMMAIMPSASSIPQHARRSISGGHKRGSSDDAATVFTTTIIEGPDSVPTSSQSIQVSQVAPSTPESTPESTPDSTPDSTPEASSSSVTYSSEPAVTPTPSPSQVEPLPAGPSTVVSNGADGTSPSAAVVASNVSPAIASASSTDPPQSVFSPIPSADVSADTATVATPAVSSTFVPAAQSSPLVISNAPASFVAPSSAAPAVSTTPTVSAAPKVSAAPLALSAAPIVASSAVSYSKPPTVSIRPEPLASASSTRVSAARLSAPASYVAPSAAAASLHSAAAGSSVTTSMLPPAASSSLPQGSKTSYGSASSSSSGSYDDSSSSSTATRNGNAAAQATANTVANDGLTSPIPSSDTTTHPSASIIGGVVGGGIGVVALITLAAFVVIRQKRRDGQGKAQRIDSWDFIDGHRGGRRSSDFGNSRMSYFDQPIVEPQLASFYGPQMAQIAKKPAPGQSSLWQTEENPGRYTNIIAGYGERNRETGRAPQIPDVGLRRNTVMDGLEPETREAIGFNDLRSWSRGPNV